MSGELALARTGSRYRSPGNPSARSQWGHLAARLLVLPKPRPRATQLEPIAKPYVQILIW